MKVHQIYTHSYLKNFSYILEFNGNKAFCVDPWSDDQILKFLSEKNLELVSVINTHEHGDHTRGNEGLKKVTNCQIWAHENAKGKIQGVERVLSAGEVISVEKGWEINVLDTPGHTFAHLCLLLKGPQGPTALFSGDTLFNAGVGNCYNGGDPEVLYETVSKQLYGLPDDVLLYPGHEYLENNLRFTLDREPSNRDAHDLLSKPLESKDFKACSMGLERKINTFFRLENKEFREGLTGEFSSDNQVFLSLRQLRDKW